jgi:amino acid permease
VKQFKLDLNILETVSIITFAYTAHAQLMSVANEVKDYTQPKMDCISITAILICGFLYCSVGYMGYIAFGDEVKGNVLESYPSDVIVTVARAGISGLVRSHRSLFRARAADGFVRCMCLQVAVSYPLMSKPARDSIFSLMENSTNPKLRVCATHSLQAVVRQA